ncbi:hypothetical protein D1614_02545 [Maribellus luteus]|uniref:Fucose isomerase n=2 Tax=Maribellus luteus TaxID=2305463 RepID=A0A399T333_9BACT|nr:hypothetical protein D1614_02545 [Maribellus luteus]
MAISPFSFGASKTVKKVNNLKIRIIYSLHEIVQDRPDWPCIGFDFKPIIDNVNSILRHEFPNTEFISTLATGPKNAEDILNKDKTEKIDGYIIYQMNCWNKVVQTISNSNKPVLYVDFQYGGSGGFLVYNAKFLREKKQNVGFVSSSKIEDVIAAVNCFETIRKDGFLKDFATATTFARMKMTPSPGNLACKTDDLKTLSIDECKRRMKKSKILAVRNQDSGSAKSVMGIPLGYVSFSEVNHAWENANNDEAGAIAEKWQTSASEVADVPFKELQNSAAMYLGMKSVLKKHNANAITVNCLGGFYGNHINAYPCLGFHELNNEGLIGACECDINSSATMVAFTIMTQGRPGYISDPVIDTSKNQIIYAHCVAPNKMFGADGPSNPFNIMTHSEDRQGAAVQSILPLGYMTTTLKIDSNRKEIILHQAKAIDNDTDDRACRTKLCAEPIGDIEKLFTKWDKWGWHRVTFYGDLREKTYELANSIGWQVIEEA